ncbi:MAG: transglycosylase SLT domain-containing protein [Candidatus Obscuribacter sp.]|nr:transglycosylase SLT domain-containing protein [Candidatus Obscuribacter sp.]
MIGRCQSKKTSSGAIALIALSAQLAPLFSTALSAPCLAQSPHKAAVKSEIPTEVSNLWRRPSQAFGEVIASLGETTAENSIARLRSFLANNPGTTERHFAAYALARLLSKSKAPEDRKEALEIFTDTSSYSLLKTLCLWHCAELAAAQADEERLRNILSTISKAHEAETQEIARATYELAQSYLRTNETDKAKALLLTLKQRFPSTEYAKGANYYIGQMALNNAIAGLPGAQDDPLPLTSAVQNFRDYLKGSTSGRFSAEVADKLMSLNAGTVQTASGSTLQIPPLTADDLDLIGLVYYKKNDYNKALSLWQKAGSNRNFQKAQCLGKLGKRTEAVEMLLDAIAKDPAATNYDDYTDTITGPLSRADTCVVWRKIMTLNPKHADHAIWNVAVRSEDKEAITLFEKLLAQFPTSEHAPESLWWIFWHQTKAIFPAKIQANKVRAQALAQLAQSGAMRYPKHVSAARFSFWSGKLHEKLGNAAQAHQAYSHAVSNYPNNYYGSRARARLHVLAAQAAKKPGTDSGWSTQPGREDAPKRWNWPHHSELFDYDQVAREIGVKAALLATAGQYDEALIYVDAHDNDAALQTSSGKELLSGFKGWLFLRQGQEIEAIRAAARNLGDHPQPANPRWRMLYPWAYAGRIDEEARIRKVDPYLVHALIREESRYYPRALSRSNAIGLMQLLPGTAFGVAKRIGLPLTNKEEIFIPDNNIKMGTAYLNSTLSRFNGNAMLAVASYNGGPNAVKRWLDAFTAAGGNDLDVFVENIPYRETRDYVRKVFGSYWTYHIMYPPGRG